MNLNRYADLKPFKHTRVRLIQRGVDTSDSYINANWEAQPFWTGQGWGDTRVQVNQTVLTNWRNTTAGPRYLHSQADLYSEIGWSN